MPLDSGRLLVNGSSFYLGNSTSNLCQLALKTDIPSGYIHPAEKQCNYAYTHPSTKQCSWTPDLSNVQSSGLNFQKIGSYTYSGDARLECNTTPNISNCIIIWIKCTSNSSGSPFYIGGYYSGDVISMSGTGTTGPLFRSSNMFCQIYHIGRCHYFSIENSNWISVRNDETQKSITLEFYGIAANVF